MKHAHYRSLFSIVSVIAALSASAAVVTDDDLSSNAELTDELFSGYTVTVSNIVVTDWDNCCVQRGTFTAASSDNIGLASGVILSTGDISLAENSNSSVEANVQHPAPSMGNSGDPDMDVIVDTSTDVFDTFDTVVLEFDFVAPTGYTKIKFTYVFASEEYPEYVTNLLNDAFAIMIDTTAPDHNDNIALIPGTSLPVTIDNLNASTNSTYYRAASSSIKSVYDGYSEKGGNILTATHNITAGTTYKVKIAVADAGDTEMDSAVFLKASFE